MSPLRGLRLSLAVATALTGVAALVGWHADVPALNAGGDGRLPMAYTTAWGLVLMGLALAAKTVSRWRLVIPCLAGTGTLCALQLALLLLPRGSGQELQGVLAHPSPRATIALILSATGVALTHGGRGGTRRLYAGLAGVLVVGLGAVSALSTGVSLRQLFEIGLNTAGALCFLGLGLLLASWTAAPDEPGPRVRARRQGLLAAGVTTLAFCLLWQLLLLEERGRMLDRVHATSKGLVDDVRLTLHDEVVEPLEGMSGRWQFRGGMPRSEWLHEATDYMRTHPAVDAVAVLDPDGEPRFWAPEATGAELRLQAHTPPGREVLQRALQSHQSQVSEGMPTEPGEPARFWVVVPIRAGVGRVIVASVSYEQFLNNPLRALSSVGWSVAVTAGGVQVAGEASPKDTNRGLQEYAVLGEPWVFEVWPSEQLLESGRTPLPELALLVGLAFSALMAAVVDGALLDRQRAGELKAANERLGSEVRERMAAELRLAEQAAHLERTARELARSNQDLERFASVAAHDLRSPLRGIHNLSRWLEEDLGEHLQGESKENMQLLQARVKRMEDLLESLLTYARSTRGGHASEELRLSELVREEWDLLHPPEGFELELAPDLPRIHSPRAPLAQVFRNLLGNALKHHDRRQGTISVRARRLDETRWEFEVADDGPGIPASMHEHVFGLFKRLQSRDKVEGAGMGLALVKRLVERAGGTVAIVPGDSPRGTTFRLTWPDGAAVAAADMGATPAGGLAPLAAAAAPAASEGGGRA